MSANKYEIFSGVNGHVYACIFGKDNAQINARSLAQKHGIKIGYALCGSTQASYVYPIISSAFIPVVEDKVQKVLEYHTVTLYEIDKLEADGRAGSREWSYQKGMLEAIEKVCDLLELR